MRRRPFIACLITAVAAAAGALPGVAAGAPSSRARLRLEGAFYVHRAAVTVPGRPFAVRGVVRPFVAGQWVRVRLSVDQHVFKTDRLRIKPGAGGSYGTFTERVRSPAPGIVRVRVVHARTPQMAGFLAVRAVAALAASAGPGQSGQFVQLIQQRLAARHVYVPQTGVFDEQTALALDAYHRLLGAGTSQALDPATVTALLDGRGTFAVRYPHDGHHAEADLTRQLLALIDGSHVTAIYPISSGKPSTPTILGRFRVYLKDPGYLPDGMYFSSFFSGGYAIHGYNPAPDYPASHGCLRLPIIDAISAYDWLKMGDRVDVYYR